MRLLKLILTAILSWYPFMCVHELGHIISAQFTQGEIQNVILVPWKFSQTVIINSNYPLVDAWAGAIFSTTIPLLIFLILKKAKKANYFISIFTGFCLLANGLYLGLGWIDNVGDTGDILAHNGNIGSMITFGVLSCLLGLFIWHQTLEKQKKVK